MSCTSRTQTQFFEAADVYLGKPHLRCITTIENASDVLDGTYFEINGFQVASLATESYLSEFLGYIYFGSDPSLTGRTGLGVTISDGDSAATVASAIKSAIDGDSTFSSIFKVSVSGDVVSIENRHIGEITEEADGALTAATGFTFEVGVSGIGGNIGRTLDAIELTFEIEESDVTSNQTGSSRIDAILTGQSFSTELSLIDLDVNAFRVAYSVIGNYFTPNNGSSEIIGVGEDRLFQSQLVNSARFMLHPTRLPSNDRSRDFFAPAVSVIPNSINFDGTSQQALTVGLAAIFDPKIDKKANLYAIKDWSQLL